MMPAFRVFTLFFWIMVWTRTGCAPSIMTPLYSASKHAVIGFSRSMALLPQVKDNNIRIVCICPGAIDAPMYHTFREKVTGWRGDLMDRNLENIGLLRVDAVTEGMIKLLQDQDNNGKQLYVSVKYGMGYRNVEEEWAKEFIELQTEVQDA